jgi:hypothetical protein
MRWVGHITCRGKVKKYIYRVLVGKNDNLEDLDLDWKDNISMDLGK